MNTSDHTIDYQISRPCKTTDDFVLCSITQKDVQIWAKSIDGKQPKRPKPPVREQPAKLKQIQKRRQKNKQARKSRRK